MLSKRAITLCKNYFRTNDYNQIQYAIIGGLMSGGLKSGGLKSGGLMPGGLMSGGLKYANPTEHMPTPTLTNVEIRRTDGSLNISTYTVYHYSLRHVRCSTRLDK